MNKNTRIDFLQKKKEKIDHIIGFLHMVEITGDLSQSLAECLDYMEKLRDVVKANIRSERRGRKK